MPNPKGNPQIFEPAQPKAEEPMTATISFRATEGRGEGTRRSARVLPSSYPRKAR